MVLLVLLAQLEALEQPAVQVQQDQLEQQV